MAIKINNKKEKITLDLNGPDGNAMVLISLGGEILEKMGHSKEEVAEFRGLMMSNNYEYIVKHFDREFGDYVDLIMSQELHDSIFNNKQNFS